MQGTVTKKRDRWYICYYTGKDGNGKWKQKWEGSWETKKEAQRILRQRISDIEGSFGRKTESTTLEAYLKYWLETYCEERLAANTVRGYQVNIEKHIIPYIGKIALNRLQPKDIQNLYTKLLQSGLSGTSVRYVHNNLHRALRIAERQQLIAKNPANYVEPPTVERYEAAVLNAEQIRQLLQVCEGTEIYMPVFLAVTLGLRRGEVLGLQWSDVDWAHKTITINRSVTFTKAGVEFGKTKSKNSHRTLLLPAGAYLRLEEEKKRQEEREMFFGKAYNVHELICCRADGSPLTSNVLQHHFSAALHQCEMPHIRFHDLRHTNATLMLQNSVPAKIVSAMLGHSSIGITLDTYSHVMTEMQGEAVGVMDAVLGLPC